MHKPTSRSCPERRWIERDLVAGHVTNEIDTIEFKHEFDQFILGQNALKLLYQVSQGLPDCFNLTVQAILGMHPMHTIEAKKSEMHSDS